MCFKNVLTVLVIVSLALTATVAQAGLVDIQNPGLEKAVTAPPTDWGALSGASVWYNGQVANAFSHAGTQFAFMSAGSAVGRMYQQLTTDGVTPYQFAYTGDTLTIDFWVAKRPEEGGYNTDLFYATLYASAAPTGPVGIDDGYIDRADGLGPTSSTWTQKSFTYVATAADVGKSLWLQFDNYHGGDGNHASVLLDDVSGSYSTIPEPGTLALLAAGLAGLLCYAWRKRK